MPDQINQLRTLEQHLPALTDALHQRWHVGCTRECGGRLDDYLFAAGLLAEDGAVTRIVTQAAEQLAATRVRAIADRVAVAAMTHAEPGELTATVSVARLREALQ